MKYPTGKKQISPGNGNPAAHAPFLTLSEFLKVQPSPGQGRPQTGRARAQGGISRPCRNLSSCLHLALRPLEPASKKHSSLPPHA